MRRSMMAIRGLCCLASALAAAAEVDYEKAATEALKAGKLADVNRLCSKWAAAEPGNERPRLILGRALLKAGMVDRAVEQFELAAEANPLSPAPRCEMGLLFLRQKKPVMAAKEFDEALRVDPKYLPAQLGRARVKLAEGEAEAALGDAKRVLQSSPGSADARALVADCLLALGRTEEALVEFEKAAGAAPENVDLCYGRASALELAGRAEEAHQAWTRFIELEPEGERAERVENGWVVLGAQALRPSLVGSGGCSAVSPDGKHVAFIVVRRGMFRASLLNPGEPTLITPCPEGWKQRHLAWSPDGASLLYQSFSVQPVGGHCLRRVPAAADQNPESIELAGLKAPGKPAWSPSGNQIVLQEHHPLYMLFLLNVSTGERREFKLVNKAGQFVYAGTADYMPNGRELVALGALDAQRQGLWRVDIDTGKVIAKLIDLRNSRNMFTVIAVSEDGTAVAGISPGEPSHLAVASTSQPSHLTRLCEAFWESKPSWHPEGRKLVARVLVRGQHRLAVVRLGGLDRRPVRIAAKRRGNTLSVILTSQAEDAQHVDVRWEAFDAASLRIGAGKAQDGPLHVKPGEEVQWTPEVDPAIAKKTQTIKIRALNDSGRGAVALVDWQE